MFLSSVSMLIWINLEYHTQLSLIWDQRWTHCKLIVFQALLDRSLSDLEAQWGEGHLFFFFLTFLCNSLYCPGVLERAPGCLNHWLPHHQTGHTSVCLTLPFAVQVPHRVQCSPHSVHLVHIRLLIQHNCHLQTFSNDKAIVACISQGTEQDYNEVIRNFVG